MRTRTAATFGWLCVETYYPYLYGRLVKKQPPSGGCVLKQQVAHAFYGDYAAATFGWLCVETLEAKQGEMLKAATFGWLCVETFTVS